MRKPHRSVPDEHAKAILAAYRQGVPTTALAKQYDVTPPTMSAFLRGHGQVLRSRSETNKLRAPVDAEELRRLVESRAHSLAQIAKLLQLSLATVERTMRALGLRSLRGRGSPGSRNYFWQGGRNIDRGGYVLVYAPNHPRAAANGCVREHRLVMEKLLGRYLEPGEAVHHRDRNRKNNDPSNLRLFSTHAEHMKHHADEDRRLRCNGRWKARP